MISTYKLDYLTRRIVTRIAKMYGASKLIQKTGLQVERVAKECKMNSKNSEVITNNVFDCLEFID